MSVPLEQFKMTRMYKEDGRWRIAGSGLYTHCPKVHISNRTAGKILKAATSQGFIRQDYTIKGRRIVEFVYNRDNDFPKLLTRKETAALVASLATELSRAAEYLQNLGRRARRYNTGVSKANSFRALRNQRERS